MKKILLFSLLMIAVCSIGCKKKSSITYETSPSSYEKKCPNKCDGGSHPHEVLTNMNICNVCGAGYN